MEQLGTMYEGEWSCLSKMYTTTEESDFMARLMGGFNSSVPYDDGALGTDDMISKLCYDNVVRSDEFLNQSVAAFHDNAEADCGSDLSLSVVSEHKRPEIKMFDSSMERKNQTKKSRKAADVKMKRNVKPKRNFKAESSSDQSSSLACSENDNNATCHGVESSTSHKVKSALNLNGKTRAGRGSATDPQSLYARKRRERINERLKTLQGLVPNGTKVDISTMLEEAVEYVKFLQLQIKLLSSDDLWMYAPLAYSGMDIGLFDSKSISNSIAKYA